MEIPVNNFFDYSKLFEDRDFYILWNEFKVLSNILLSESHTLPVVAKCMFYRRFRLLNSRIVRLIQDIDELNSD